MTKQISDWRARRVTSTIIAAGLLAACAGGCGSGDSFEPDQKVPGSGGSTTSSTSSSAGGAGGGGGTTSNAGGAGGMGGAGGTSSSVGGAGGTSTTSNTGGTGGTGGSGGAPACDPNEVAPDGVFVSVDDGDDAGGTGTQALPVKTLAKGLAIAVATSKTTVVLDQGTYPEAITLTSQHGGITITGGWEKTGTVWERDCSATARQKTLLQSPSKVGLGVNDTTAKITLHTISVQASGATPAANNEAGASCYGILAQGSTVALALDDVVVQACKGEKGGAAAKDLLAPEPDCTQLTGNHCKDGSVGSDGNEAPSAEAGTYTAQGYSPAGGTDGSTGSQGQNGTPGTDGASATCVKEGCSGGAGACGGLSCGNANGSASVTATAGKCGCGGRGGAAGAGGPGGGGSFGIFATGATTVVSVTNSVIESSSGGDGSAGQIGTAGSHGGDPVDGVGASCGGDCTSVNKGNNQCNCEQPSTYWLNGGTKGGPGGKGGLGSPGGGGSGGPSIAVVRHGGATVLADGKSELKFGTGGQPGDAKAAIGAAAAELSAP